MSSPEEIHIVTHQVPWPIDFGGVFDLFYKIKALSASGVKIHLHCFTKNNEEASILEQYCFSVNYYQRSSFFSGSNFTLPFIVRSRSSRLLIDNLKKDNHPILFEGIHCSYPLLYDLGKERKIKIRLHNVEYLYYNKLAHLEYNPIKKLYFKTESFLLKKFEHKISQVCGFWTVSEKDSEKYVNEFGCKDVRFLPVFIPWNKVSSSVGNGNYCLYHGNLEVNENIRAVEWLLDEVFSKLEIPLVIAGKNPSASLKEKVYQFKHTCIVENLSEHEMDDLIAKAQINILPSFNHTGVKLKVLHALFNGRFCLINQDAIDGSGIDSGFHVFKDAKDLSTQINQLFNQSFTESDIETRKKGLVLYDNQKGIDIIKSW